MLRIFFILLLLASCSQITKKGGSRSYQYDAASEHTVEELQHFAPLVVSVEKRNPPSGKLEDLFDTKLPDIKRIGIVIFETSIQSTRSGLSGQDKIYVSEQGKQLMTEKIHSIWEEILSLNSSLDYVPSSKIKDTKAISAFGLKVPDYIQSQKQSFDSGDLMFLESGKKSPMTTIMNPRGMQDLSFVLVPATELMGGPKWSEHNKHFLNDIVKELNLDAAIIVYSDLHWTAAHKEKHSGENIPEELTVNIKASTLLPFTKYHERLKLIGNNDRPNVTLCYRTHTTKLTLPISITLPPEQMNFETIQRSLIDPLFKVYRDAAAMTAFSMMEELQKTH